jgi:hypothetical protein
MSKRQPQLTKREKRVVKKADENRDGRIYQAPDNIVRRLQKKGVLAENTDCIVPSRRPS